jgi:phospholipase C
MRAVTRASGITRRTLLRSGAAAGVTVAAARALPAWSRPVADYGRIRKPGSKPFPGKPEGEDMLPQVDHIVVVMMENHSFDNLLGMLPHRVRARRGVDGLPVSKRGKQLAVNPDATGKPVRASHAPSVCQLSGVPSQSWNASHTAWNGGRNDGFARASTYVAMWFWDEKDLPFTYSLASTFPIGDRFFCSTLCQTYPNRRFLMAGTSDGVISTSSENFSVPAANGTIFDRLDAHRISWRNYYTDAPATLIIPNVATVARQQRGDFVKIDQFYTDARRGKLPAVSFVDPHFAIQSEENPQDIQFGEQFVAKVVRAVLRSPNWRRTALFLTYDEHGGYYDHVPPPRAIKPDSTPPRLHPGDTPGAFDRYGFRVPLVVVSPYAKPNFVSHQVQDLTSILRFIERKWNIGALTFRDANAADMTGYFDFSKPAFLHPPRLAAAPKLAPGLDVCHKLGLHPPGDTTPVGT